MQMLLMRVSRNYGWKCMQRIGELDLQPRQIPLLMAIRRQEGVSQRELARIMHNTPPTVNVSIQRLEKAGLVQRRRDDADQRKIHVLLTEQGQRTCQELDRYMEETERMMFQDFTEEELKLLGGMFQRMLHNIEKIPGSQFPDCPEGQKGEFD